MVLPIKMNIPDSFFEEEERCGHIVTVREKKIWAVELDLLNEFKRVCDKYNLRWYIAYGSLLGTIRHKGFIPWDNDVDVWMPREDFHELCKHSDEFSHPYFLQTPHTEKGKYFSNYGKLCNSLTTGSWKGLYDLGINCGLFVDIFILDEIPDNLSIEKKIIKKISFFSRFEVFINSKRNLYNIKRSVRYLLWKFLLHKCDGAKLFDIIDAICNENNGKGYSRIGYLPSAYGDRDRSPKECWNEVQWVDFEMLKVPVPIGYDEILTNMYGDYMQFPPLEKRVTHEYLIMEPEISYTQYWKN